MANYPTPSDSQPAPGRSFGDIAALLNAANEQQITEGDLVSFTGQISAIRRPRTIKTRTGGQFTSQNILLEDASGSIWYVLGGNGPWHEEEDKVGWICEVKAGRWNPWGNGTASVDRGKIVLTTGAAANSPQTSVPTAPPLEYAFTGIAVIAKAIAEEYELGASALDSILDQVISWGIAEKDKPGRNCTLDLDVVLKIGRLAWHSVIRDRIEGMLPEQEVEEKPKSESHPEAKQEEAAEPPPEEEEKKDDYPF